MSNAPTTSLPPGQSSKLAVLLDALDGVALSDAERASLTWLAGFETHTVENIAAVIARARRVDLVSPLRGERPSKCVARRTAQDLADQLDRAVGVHGCGVHRQAPLTTQAPRSLSLPPHRCPWATAPGHRWGDR